jgi:hypothetical protein
MDANPFMKGVAMSPNRARTLGGIALFIPLAAVLLVTFACLPAPIGDPDTSKVDEAFTGAWELVSQGKNAAPAGDATSVALLRPWDKHTYFLTYMSIGKNDDKCPKIEQAHFKTWLTTLGDATFVVAEPADNIDYAFPDEKAEHVWIVGKVVLKDDTITFRLVKDDSAIMKDLKTHDQIEGAIKANVNNDELYGDAMKFKKMGKDQAKTVEDALKASNTGSM